MRAVVFREMGAFRHAHEAVTAAIALAPSWSEAINLAALTMTEHTMRVVEVGLPLGMWPPSQAGATTPATGRVRAAADDPRSTRLSP